MLRAEGFCLSDRRRSGAGGWIPGDDGEGFRAQVRVPYAQPDAAAGAAGGPLPLFGRGRVRNSSCETDPMPDFPILAGVGGEQARVDEDGAILPGDGEGAADPDCGGEGAGEGDAGGISGALLSCGTEPIAFVSCSK